MLIFAVAFKCWLQLDHGSKCYGLFFFFLKGAEPLQSDLTKVLV